MSDYSPARRPNALTFLFFEMLRGVAVIAGTIAFTTGAWLVWEALR